VPLAIAPSSDLNSYVTPLYYCIDDVIVTNESLQGDARYYLSATEDTASWAGKEAYPSSKSLLRAVREKKRRKENSQRMDLADISLRSLS
jgi:hypothetical protein